MSGLIPNSSSHNQVGPNVVSCLPVACLLPGVTGLCTWQSVDMFVLLGPGLPSSSVIAHGGTSVPLWQCRWR